MAKRTHVTQQEKEQMWQLYNQLGSYTKVAKKLHRSSDTVSRYVREFEAAVQGRDPAYRYSEDHHTFQRMARKGITPVYINRVTAYHPAGGVANGGNIYNPQIQERFREDKLRMWKQEIYPFWHNILPEDRKLHRKRLKLELSLHTMLQVLSVTPFEKIPLIQLFSDIEENPNMPRDANQLILL